MHDKKKQIYPSWQELWSQPLTPHGQPVGFTKEGTIIVHIHTIYVCSTACHEDKSRRLIA